MKILIVSDAWRPQKNGVVRTFEATIRELEAKGHEVLVIGPKDQGFFVFALPFYKEIKLEFFGHSRLAKILRAFAPDFIHIPTEGPLGWAMRRLCMRHGKPFTTSYHTNFPEYVAARAPRFFKRMTSTFLYFLLRRFHAPAAVVMVATPSIERNLKAHKFHRIVRWSRGVDLTLFKPYGKSFAAYEKLQRPILLNVGRVAVEKNLSAFLDLKVKGTKIVIGDGPDLKFLAAKYKDAHFLGVLEGERLAQHYAAADIFVFPSKTDTFGLVLLEACGAGLRIAAHPVPGPSDIFNDDRSRAFAVLDDDLKKAVEDALALPDQPRLPCAFAALFSWQASSLQFFMHLQAPSPAAQNRLRRWRKKIGDGI